MRFITTLLLSLVLCATAYAQDGTESYATTHTPFNGLITRQNGSGVKAKIVITGSDKFTNSDGKGRFGFSDIEPTDTLRIVLRHTTYDIPVMGFRSMHIEFDDKMMLYKIRESEELINLGENYVKRRESIDFSSGISGDRLRATGCFNLMDALKMLYPGLREVNGELSLRTTNSINSSSAVLVLCDGIDVNINTINLHDVKSVEIIKGSNMYGFRGVNGVIKVTTRRAGE